MVYGLLVLDSGITATDDVFYLVASTIVLSILAHSSTDIVVARAFDENREAPAWHGVLHGYAGRRAEMKRVDRTPPARVGGPPRNVNRQPAMTGRCRNHRRQ